MMVTRRPKGTTVLPAGWIEHRRDDREIVGWIAAEGEGYVPYDLLGRRRETDPVEWLDAEAVLETLGIGYLADRYELALPDGSRRPVRITEATPQGITVVADEFGAASAVGANSERFHLPFPAPTELSAP